MSSRIHRTLKPMSVWDEESVLAAFKEHNINPIHYLKTMSKLYDDFILGRIKHLSEFEIAQDTSTKILKIFRSGDFSLMTSRVVRREDSRDQSTTKLLVELQDGKQVEAVLMRYNNSVTGGHKRTTLCVSSQVGCAMACSFCATGTMGLQGNLYGGEILEQFIWANQVEHIRNVVFMGMGEPLNNYDAVLSAIRAMVHPNRFALQQNRVTLSTVGIVPKMLQIIEEAPYVTLALSLHAPTQAMREKIVPAAHQYHLSTLMDAIDHYYEVSKKQMLIEYVLLDDVNASEETAHLLGKLLYKRQVLLNIIPFNPVLTKAKHRAPSVETVDKFAEIVSSNYGILVTARKEFGQDISGACGQLAVKVVKNNQKQMKNQPKETLVDTYAYDEEEEEEETKENVEEDDDDKELVDNGLEGIFSAMGDFNKKPTPTDEDDGEEAKEAASNEETKTEEEAPVDVEDIDLTAMQTKKSTSSSSSSKKCPPGCACHHRDKLIAEATKGIDPSDIIAYSLAVLSTGPRLLHSIGYLKTMVNKRGLNKRQREMIERLNVANPGMNDVNMQLDTSTLSTTGSTVDDTTSSIANTDGGMSASVENSISRSTSTTIASEIKTVSDLVIPFKEQDKKPRVFMPKKNIKIEGLSDPIMVTHDDEFGKSDVLLEKLENKRGNQLLSTSVQMKQQQQQETTSTEKAIVEEEPKASVSDASDDDELHIKPKKDQDAEELVLGTNIEAISQHKNLVLQALKEKKEEDQDTSFFAKLLAPFTAVLNICRKKKEE